MARKFFFIFLLSALMAGYPAYSGAEVVSLKELLEEANANNPEIAALREKTKAREARARVEGVLDDPTIEVEMMDLSKDSPLSVSPGNAMQTKYTLRQMFPFPGKLSLREKIALKEALAAKAELRAKELMVSNMVKDAYFDYAFVDGSISITRDVKELLSYMEEVAGAKYATGLVTQQDVIKIQVEATALTNELITLDAEKGIAAARLKSLLNRPQDSPIGGPGELSKEKIPLDTGELIKKALDRNPEIKMVESEAQASELGVDLAKKNYYPDFMVGVAPIQRDGRFDNFDVMFQINIPIWRGKYDNQVREASSNAVSQRSMLLSEKNMVSLNVKSASLEVDAADRMRTLYETSLLPQAELSFESALKNYQAGKVDLLTLLDTERELKRIRLEYLKTIAEYRKRVAALERVVGEDLAAVAEK